MGSLVFLFYVQDLRFLALLNVLFIGIAAVASSPGAGACSLQGARVIQAALLQHVPGL